MNTNIKRLTAEHRLYTVGLWALLAVLALIVASGCASTGQPIQESQNPRDVGLNQGTPPTGTAEVITVDLNAVQPDLIDRDAVESCRELHGPLLQIVKATDPVQEARALGLNVREDQVQVTLVLNKTGSDFLRLAGVDLGKQTGTQVQAYVPLSQLCELAADERVEALYPVSQAETQ